MTEQQSNAAPTAPHQRMPLHPSLPDLSLLSYADMNIKMLSPSCDESKRMVDWVEKGECPVLLRPLDGVVASCAQTVRGVPCTLLPGAVNDAQHDGHHVTSGRTTPSGSRLLCMMYRSHLISPDHCQWWCLCMCRRVRRHQEGPPEDPVLWCGL
jgi:hypothetical protein